MFAGAQQHGFAIVRTYLDEWVRRTVTLLARIKW
jgi:hypothetical protein